MAECALLGLAVAAVAGLALFPVCHCAAHCRPRVHVKNRPGRRAETGRSLKLANKRGQSTRYFGEGGEIDPKGLSNDAKIGLSLTVLHNASLKPAVSVCLQP